MLISLNLIDYDQESLTLDFVQREFDVNSIEEFHEYAKGKAMDSKDTEIMINARNEILDTLIGKSIVTAGNKTSMSVFTKASAVGTELGVYPY